MRKLNHFFSTWAGFVIATAVWFGYNSGIWIWLGRKIDSSLPTPSWNIGNIARPFKYIFEKYILVYINCMTLLRWNRNLFYLSISLVGSCELLYNFLSWLLNLNEVLSNPKEFCKEKKKKKIKRFLNVHVAFFLTQNWNKYLNSTFFLFLFSFLPFF